MGKFSILKELWLFIRREKKWWLLPIVVILILIAVIIIFGESSVLAPLLYPLF